MHKLLDSINTMSRVELEDLKVRISTSDSEKKHLVYDCIAERERTLAKLGDALVRSSTIRPKDFN